MSHHHDVCDTCCYNTCRCDGGMSMVGKEKLAKKITIRVTAKDIAEGKPNASQFCPVALAANRAGVQDAIVTFDEVCGRCEGLKVRGIIPPKVRAFIRQFDAVTRDKRLTSKPFQFTITV